MTNITINDITGVILAGGQARRMGGQDKGLIQLSNRPMIQHVIDRISPQVNSLIINANRNQAEYESFGYPVISDELNGFCGPLAGFSSALDNISTNYLVTTPCDSPFIPKDMVIRLYNAMDQNNADISVVQTNNRLQPVFCLLKKSLLSSLNSFLELGERKIDKWFALHNMIAVDFSDESSAFNNINTQDDLSKAEQR